jgi:hypothetical protein
MFQNLKIFSLVLALLAKFTLTFFGQEDGLETKSNTSIFPTKVEWSAHQSYCFIDENEQRLEGDDDNDDQNEFSHNFEFHYFDHNGFQVNSSFEYLNSVPIAEVRYIKLCNLRL